MCLLFFVYFFIASPLSYSAFFFPVVCVRSRLFEKLESFYTLQTTFDVSTITLTITYTTTDTKLPLTHVLHDQSQNRTMTTPTLTDTVPVTCAEGWTPKTRHVQVKNESRISLGELGLADIRSE